MIKDIMAAVTIPVMAKARIGHFAEAQILQEIGVDMIDESEGIVVVFIWNIYFFVFGSYIYFYLKKIVEYFYIFWSNSADVSFNCLQFHSSRVVFLMS